ncbi:hypothetical protein OCU04_006337 [Sclerotinia nivalis]|uniref:O-methyltransferase n=1 Tax=Sclerotinia nivalis TaxID=352851 RepID=A0A9X0AN16_9HELO|nr:hypothetical protein OCU04_006337 [Sclerotinia nivalis]
MTMSAYDFKWNRDFSEEVCSRLVSADKFICDSVLPHDPILNSALKANVAAGLDNIDVAPNQGKLYYLLARLASAKKILDVGTLGGYSAIWFAQAIPGDGKVVTLPVEPKHAQGAESNNKNAGFEKKIQVRVGPALDTLKKMESEGWGLGKENEYVDHAAHFSRGGTLIVVDNVGRRGKTADETCTEGQFGDDVVGTRRMFEMMGKDKRIDVTAVQTVGSKGWDDFALALVVEL